MSDQLPTPLENLEVPEHLRQYQNESADSLVTGFVGLPSLSIRGKQFHYEKDGQEVTVQAGMPIQVVILAADPPQGVAKSWYEGAYTPGDDSPPDCASSNGIAPDAFYDSPQCEACAGCPHNQFGSGTDAKGKPTKGKACSDYKNLFVVHADAMDGAIYSLRVPATSLKALSKFGKVLGSHKLPMHVVITQLSFENTEHPQLVFQPVGYLNAQDAAAMAARSESSELKLSLPSLNQTGKAPEPTVATLSPPPATSASLPPPPSGALPPPPPSAAPQKVMTPLANGIAYDDYIAQGWTDEQLIEHGYMES